MTEIHPFQPQWASAPGETIVDLLDERGMSSSDLAAAIGETCIVVEQLLAGTEALTDRLALKLEAAFGAPADFWLRRETSFRAALERRQAAESTEAKRQWLHSLPLKDMMAFGWLPEVPKEVNEAASLCLRFFDEPDLSSWRGTFSDEVPLAAFRTSPTVDSDAAAVAAWLRRGEVLAAALKCAPWDPARFRAALFEIRALTNNKKPKIFVPELQRVCANSGVAVVIVRAPSGCRASGATRFLSADRAILMLSFRYLSDDHFWFTFFHEAGHLLLHDNGDTFLEGINSSTDRAAREANDFAARTLIPPEFEAEMLRLKVDGREVVRFATRAGVSPGIVVGQLQHRRVFTRRQLNDLKRRFSWD